MAHDVFVSHSVKDAEVAQAIVARLEAESIRCWVAPRDVVPGADWGESIINAIESSRIMVLVFSRDANASRQIKREVERADDKGVYTIPCRIDDTEPTKSLEYFISTAQWMDLFPPPLEPHLDTLAETVATVLASLPPREAARKESGRPEVEHSKMVRQQVPERKRGATDERRASLPLRLWILSTAILAILIAAGAGWYFGHGRSRSQEIAIPQHGEETGSPSKQGQEDDGLKVTDRTASIVVPPADTQAIPKIAGVWHDGYNPSIVSQITQDGHSFTFQRSGVLPDGFQFRARGSGEISGLQIKSSYEAWYQPSYQASFTSSGSCTGSVSADGMHMTLTCKDSVYGYSAGEANRE
jgi:hypothetical protein